MIPYKNTIVMMTHGINSDRYTWAEGKLNGDIDYSNRELWAPYLIHELGISDKNIKHYSFSTRSGRHEANMLEFGYGGYENPASGKTETNGVVKQQFVAGVKVAEILGNPIGAEAKVVVKETVVKSGIRTDTHHSWLEQAKDEYRNELFNSESINPQNFRIWNSVTDIPEVLLPEKLVMVAHSQGNFAVRGYIHSGDMARKGAFDDEVGNNGFDEKELAKIKATPLGFYEWPVEKAVFVNPTLRGSTIRSWLVLNKFRNMNDGVLNKYKNWEWAGEDVQKAMGLVWASVLMADGWEGVYREAYGQGITQYIENILNPIKQYDESVGSIARTGQETIDSVGNTSKWMQDKGGDPLRWVDNTLNLKGLKELVEGAIGSQSQLYNLSQGLMLKGDNKGSDVGFKSVSVLDDLTKIKMDYNVGYDLGLGQKFQLRDIRLLEDMYKKPNWVWNTITMLGEPKIPWEAFVKSYNTFGEIMQEGMYPLGRWVVPLVLMSGDEPSIQGKNYNVGVRGTEVVLKDIVLGRHLDQSDKRKWQPKYRVLAVKGGLALDEERTLLGAKLEAAGRLVDAFKIDKSRMGDAYHLSKNPYLPLTLTDPKFWSMSNYNKFLSLTVSQMLGGVFTQPGDVVVGESSLRGDGVAELDSSNTQRYMIHQGSPDLERVIDNYLTVMLGLDVVLLVQEAITGVDLPKEIKGLMRLGLVSGVSMGIAGSKESIGDSVNLHYRAMSSAMKDGYGRYMDKSLYEPPKIIMDGIYGELDTQSSETRGISQASVTTNYVVTITEPGKPVTRFSALPESNWAGVKFTWPSYERVVGTTTPNEVIARGVTVVSTNGQPMARKIFYERIPTFNIEAGGDQSMLVRDSRYEYEQPISVVSLGNESVILRGSLMDFTPRHPETVLEYSSNFSGWARVPVVNDYGHFELGPMTLYEGQNVIAFRAKNRAGYTSNQILKILKTGITLQPVLDEILPIEESITNDNRPMISLAYQNMKYSDSAANKITLDSLVLSTGNATGNEVIANVTQKQVIRDRVNRLEITYRPTTPLSDGTYYITAKAKDAYNTGSFIRYGFTIDTTAPVVTIAPITAINPELNPGKAVGVEVTVTDNGNFAVKKLELSVIKPGGATIYKTEIASGNTGITTIEWVPTASMWADGRYEVKVEVTDMAGNKGSAVQRLDIDRAPAEIVEMSGMTGVYTQTTVNAEVRITTDETVNAVVVIRNSKGEIVHQAAMTPVGAQFIAPDKRRVNQ